MRNGPNAIKGSYGFLRGAFKDMVIEHHDVIVDGDLVGLRWTWQATHYGPFLGIPPTGARVSIEGYDLILVHDGKITGAWVYQDNLSLMAQLGAAAASHGDAKG
jgi:predicted ester cyclase